MSLLNFCDGQIGPAPAGTIVLDMSNLIFRALYADANRDDTSEEMFRHLAVSQVLKYRTKFAREDYPYLVCAFDGPELWRRKEFKEYKKNRDISLKLEKIDNPEEAEMVAAQGKQVMEAFSKIRDELIENLPYPCICVAGAEADDVIAIVVKESKKAIIVSADRDFQQLTTFTPQRSIQLFSPSIPPKGGFYQVPPQIEKERDLFEKICRGDGGDGVPNILSPNETFWPVKIRQKAISSKMINTWWNSRTSLSSVMDEKTLSRYKRNLKMIDLAEIPEIVESAIISELNNKLTRSDTMASNKFVSYLMSKGLKHLLGRAHLF
jgi:hypothetical protein